MSITDSPEPELSFDHEHGPSLRLRIIALGVGETLALARRIPIEAATKEAINDAARKLMNVAGPAIGRAKVTTGGEYTRDVADTLTPRRDVVALLLITRTA